MSSAGAVGVDLGGMAAVIAVAKKGGVEVIANEASSRETPIVVGFGENERFIGEAGYVQLKSNFKNTIVYPNRFLGIRGDAPYFNDEKKWLYNAVTVHPDNKVTFDVLYRGERTQFTPEQITATFLQKIKTIVRKNDVGHNDMVLSVPSYWTEQERKALLDAAKIAELNVVKLLNESAAITLGYGIFRKAEFDATPRHVCFIDFGQTNTSVFVSSFTNQKAKILNQVHERNLGVRDIDWQLLEFYGKYCLEQYDSNPIKKEKPRMRMIDAIEKQRKILSANSDANINVDYIVEDNDLSYHLTREKLEEIMAPVVQKFRDTLEALKAEIKVPLHSIEIVGGGTRIPIIQRIIKEVFGLEVSRTLNATECIAKGCAIQAAMLSPLFKVAQYEVEEANYYPIRCSWIFRPEGSNIEIESDAGNKPEKQTSVLFDKGCSLPNIKSVTFHREEIIDFKLTYDPAPPGASALLANFVVHPCKVKEKEFGIKLRVQLNRNGVLEFDSAQCIEEYIEEDNKMVEEKPAGEAPKTAEVKKKTKTTKLNVDISFATGFNEGQLAQLFEQECQMSNQDRVVQETSEKKNELESYIYDMRGKLDDKYLSFVHPQQKQALLAELQKAEDWIYGEGAKTTKSVYAQHLEALKKLGDPITNRFREYELIPDVLNQFTQNLGTYTGVATSTDPNFEHITQEERNSILQGVEEQKNWIAQVADSVSKAPKTENPPVSSNDVLARHKAFVDKFYAVINKPKPKPEATKTEAPKPDTQKEASSSTQDNKMEEEK